MFKWKLRACRVQAGYRQKAAAKLLGISEATLVSYETGRVAPNMEVGQKMSELYGIPMDLMDFTRVGNSSINGGNEDE
jgi:DNA-binding XRE family transcriptional regulator